MCAKQYVGLHVQCSFLLYDLTKTGMCRHIFSIGYGEYSFNAVNVNYGQTDRWSKVNRCMFKYFHSVRARKEEGKCMAVHLHSVTAWKI